MSVKSTSVANSQRTVTSSSVTPPPFAGSGASRVQMITEFVDGSPEATPSVKGSTSKGAGAKVVDVVDVDPELDVVDDTESPDPPPSDFEQAATTTDAPRAKKRRREIGVPMTESCQTRGPHRDGRVS